MLLGIVGEVGLPLPVLLRCLKGGEQEFEYDYKRFFFTGPSGRSDRL